MATPPHLVSRDGAHRLDVAVGATGRRQLALSDRAAALLVDDLWYGDHDLLPWLTTRTVVLAGGATRRDGPTDPLELAWSITGADRAPDPDDEEVQHLGAYLRRVEVDEAAAPAVRELVATSRLTTALDPAAVRSTRDRRRDLRGIAKDL